MKIEQTEVRSKPKLKLSKKKLKRPFSAKPQNFVGVKPPALHIEEYDSTPSINMFQNQLTSPDDLNDIQITLPKTRPQSAITKQVKF